MVFYILVDAILRNMGTLYQREYINMYCPRFLIHIGAIGTLCYNASLSIYYVLSIRHNIKDTVIQKYYEPIMHCISIIFPFSVGISSIILQLYNPTGWCCGIVSYPPWCTSDAGGDCIRGPHAAQYNLYFWHIPAWIIMIIVMGSMISIYCKIRRIELNSSMYHSTRRSQNYLQKQFAITAIMYVSAMFFTWILYTVNYIYYYVSGQRVNWYLSFFASILLPLQGFLNALIYFGRTRGGGGTTTTPNANNNNGSRQQTTSSRLRQSNNNLSMSHQSSSQFVVAPPAAEQAERSTRPRWSDT